MGGGAAGPAERRRPRHRVEDRDEMCGAINTHRGCCEDDESWARLHLGSRTPAGAFRVEIQVTAQVVGF